MGLVTPEERQRLADEIAPDLVPRLMAERPELAAFMERSPSGHGEAEIVATYWRLIGVFGEEFGPGVLTMSRRMPPASGSIPGFLQVDLNLTLSVPAGATDDELREHARRIRAVLEMQP